MSNHDKSVAAGEMPTFDRMILIAAGEAQYTPAEQQARVNSPWWSIRESQAFLALVHFESKQDLQEVWLEKSIDAMLELPDSEATSAAFAYLHTFVPDGLHNRFGELSIQRGIDISNYTILDDVCGTPTENNPNNKNLQSVRLPSEDGYAATLEKRKPHLRWLSDSRFVAASLVAIVATIPLLLLFLPRTTNESHIARFDGRVEARNVETSGKGVNGENDAYHYLDELTYENSIVTDFRHVSLVTIDDERAYVRGYAQAGGSPVVLRDHMQLDSRDCFEFFVIIIADDKFLPNPSPKIETPTEVPWLSAISDELQLLGVNDNSSNDEVATRVVAAIRQSGFRGELEVSVDRITHESTRR